jgi:hypothetical protein
MHDGIVDIISPHVTALMQVLTNDFPQYNMRLIVTKCLNTGIMLMFFLLGKKGLRMVDQCDSNRVTERHQSGVDDNVAILKQLKQQMISTREKRSKLYYILLSDGHFPKITQEPNPNEKVNTQSTKYFPGHVVIIEKHFDFQHKEHYFRFHQSYINKYTLKQYNAIAKKTISIENINNILNSLEHVMTSSTWTKSNIKIWSKLTNVDTSELSNTLSKNRFFLCFRKAEMQRCVASLRKYIKTKLVEVKQHAPAATYGDASLYLDPMIALTNSQIQEELHALLVKLEQHERICYKHNNE